MKNIKIQKAPNNVNTAQSFFEKNDFDISIWEHGYNVIIEKAIRCPCKSKGADNLSNCKNCSGTGWLFINPVKTKAILTSQNSTTKFKDWSEENIGNVNISVRDIDRLGFMDRLTVLDGQSIHSQTAYPVVYNGVLFSFLNYEPKCITDVFLFKESSKKLIFLKEKEDYQIIESKIIFDSKFVRLNKPIFDNMTISVRYIHAPQYHVIDIIRDVMVTPTNASQGFKFTQMPISAQGRRAHYVLDRQNFEGDLLFDNSYEKLCDRDECNENQCNNNPL